jgi:hypothetical protein
MAVMTADDLGRCLFLHGVVRSHLRSKVVEFELHFNATNRMAPVDVMPDPHPLVPVVSSSWRMSDDGLGVFLCSDSAEGVTWLTLAHDTWALDGLVC